LKCPYPITQWCSVLSLMYEIFNYTPARISKLEYLIVVLSVEGRQTNNSLSSVGTGCKVSGIPSLGNCYPSHGMRTSLSVGTCWVRTTALQLFGQCCCSGQTLLLHQLSYYGFHSLCRLQKVTRFTTYNQYLGPMWFYFTLSIEYTKWTQNRGSSLSVCLINQLCTNNKSESQWMSHLKKTELV
jgi:hypothetical protein